MTHPAPVGGYPQGVKLGVDVGTVRVGVALCDRDSILATPYKTLDRNARKNSDVRVIANLVAELGAVQVFVGLPRTLKGEERASAQMAWEYAELLAAELSARSLAVPVNLVDERLSSVTAHRNLHQAGVSSRDHRKVIDQVAAAGILQHAIDMQKARGTDVGSRVDAPAPAVEPVSGGLDQSIADLPGDTARSSDNGRQQ